MLCNKLLEYEQLICSGENLHSLLDSRKEAIELLEKEKAKTETLLDSALKKIEAMEMKNYERIANKANSPVAAQSITPKEEVQKSSRTNVLVPPQPQPQEMKPKAHMYVPVHEDNIDAKLAEQLNSLTDPKGYSMLFTREAEGVYHFGTKRVFAKLENGKVMSKLQSI